MTRLAFLIPGEPEGKGRPKFNRAQGRAYTPTKTRLAETAVRNAWQAARHVRLPDGPVGVSVEVVLERPGNHFRVDGSLSAAGLRSPYPTKRPDWDNVAKLVCDALEKRAYRNDAAVVDARVIKRWARKTEDPHTRVELWSLSVGGSVA